MLSTSPRQQTSVTVERGYPLALGLSFTKEDDEPLDLTGAELWFDLRKPKHKGGTQLIAQRPVEVSEEPTLGLAFLGLQGTDLTLAAGTYDFDVTVRTAGGFAALVVKGTFEVVENANSTGTEDFTSTAETSTLEVRLLKRNRITVRVNHYPDEKLLAYVQLAQAMASQAGIDSDEAAASAAAAAASASAADADRVVTEAARTETQGYRGDTIFAAQAGAAAQTAAETAAGTATGAAAAALTSQEVCEQIAEELGLIEGQVGSDVFVLEVNADLPFGRPGDLVVQPDSEGRIHIFQRTEDEGQWTGVLMWLPVPTGGAAGQVLTKAGGSLYDWANPVLVAHNHDTAYSPLGHNHDGSYLAKTADIQAVVKITQAAYDALGAKVATTLYVIVG